MNAIKNVRKQKREMGNFENVGGDDDDDDIVNTFSV